MKWAFIFLAILVQTSFAQECTHLWHKNLTIDPPFPRPNSGDTFAAYGLLGFKNDKKTKFVVKGNFAKARFTSLESYIKEDKLAYDAIFDYQINPDAGSENPFREGVSLETPNRAYTLELVPAAGKSTRPNVLHFSPTEKIYSFYFRIYSPNKNVVPTDADIPRVWAYDAQTGEPKACPEYIYTSYEPKYPQALINLVAAFTKFEFKTKVVKNGHNHAIPYYMWAINRVRHGDVTVVRMKAPTFFNSHPGVGPFQKSAQIRYWSICTQNYVINQTLKCLPDYLAKYDENQYVTVVVGKGKAVKEHAEKRGYNFMEDLRKPDQKVVGFAYRNMLLDPSFEKEAYKGDYVPKGTVCTEAEFLSDDCE
jgi:hypothetical protein